MYFSHRSTLRRLDLRNAQVLVQQRDGWERLREQIEELKKSELPNVSAAGGVPTARDVRLSDAMTRMYQVREAQPIFFAPSPSELSELQSANVPDRDASSVAIEDEIPGRQLSALDAPLSLFPPGTDNPRQTPRRPGAPSFAPALINHFQINAGARAAPEIRLS